MKYKKAFLCEENPYFELLVLKCQFQVVHLKQRGLLSGTAGDVSRCSDVGDHFDEASWGLGLNLRWVLLCPTQPQITHRQLSELCTNVKRGIHKNKIMTKKEIRR